MVNLHRVVLQGCGNSERFASVVVPRQQLRLERRRVVAVGEKKGRNMPEGQPSTGLVQESCTACNRVMALKFRERS